MKMKQIVTLGAMLFVSSSALASTIDYRTEYKHDTKQHGHRIKLGTEINDIKVGMEMKFKSADTTDFAKDIKSTGVELALAKDYKLNDQWTLQPGLPIEMSNSGTTFKPQLRATYRPDSVEGLSVSGRYRADIKGTDNSDSEIDHTLRHRATFNLGYSVNDWNLGFETNYYKSQDSSYLLYNNKDSNYEHNLTAKYRMGDWQPYVEFGDVSVDKNSSDREYRSRLGITYRF